MECFETCEDCQNPINIMNMIVKEINRLCSMSKEQIHEWFWQMEDILIHNHNHILEIYKHEPKGPELIKYLHDRIS